MSDDESFYEEGSDFYEALVQGDLPYLQARINSENVNTLTFDRRPPIFVACGGDLEVFKWLISIKADVNFVTNTNETPLMEAMMCSNDDFYKLLLEAGAIIKGFGPFTMPDTRPERVKLILAADPESALARDPHNGQIAMHWAAMRSLESCRLLLDARSPLDAVDDGGSTPLHRALRNDYMITAEFLLDRGADPLKINTAPAFVIPGWVTGVVAKRQACRAACRAVLSLLRRKATVLGDNGRDVLVVIAKMMWETRKSMGWSSKST
jgi:ankyrin repeat protein